MDERGLKSLEFSKVINILIGQASTVIGKELAANLLPTNDFSQVIERQSETKEALEAIRLAGGLNLGGVRDIRAYLKRVSLGGDLLADQLQEIAATIYAGRKLKRFINKLAEEHSLPILFGHAEALNELTDLEQSINRCINEYGEIADSASSELRAIRQQIRVLEGRVKEKIDSILRNNNHQKMLQEAIVTIRNGRYVIPVKQEYRTAFGGIVHDQSASGATLFIEPAAVLAASNLLKEQQLKEEKEIERILRVLTNEVRVEIESLLINVEHLGTLDFIQAKAGLASEMKGIMPKINREGYIRLKKARHPLISPLEVVPTDIELGKSFTSIVITGPNTGGKTVALKTIGLLSLMGMAGLHIPAEEDSELTIFSAVFADIGDEQSIEQSLSTFSGHLTNIIKILKKMDKDSLILLDELGAGTDPTEGAAIAVAILETIRGLGARVVATTHYSELKAYAYNREGVMNASVEFDVDTLRPTYRLLIGVPGRSNAFAIAKRLGLQEDIITLAKGQISEDNMQVESMIASLEVNKRTAEKERSEAELLRKEAQAINQQLEKRIAELENEKEHALREAKQKAEEIVKKARLEAETVIAELRKLAQEEQAGIKEHKLIAMKKRLDEAVPSTSKVRKQKKFINNPIGVGDEVKVLSFGQKGLVVEKVSDKEFVVQIGILKMKIADADLELLETKKEQQKEYVSTGVKRSGGVRPELDVRGQTVDDAIMSIDNYLDEAFMEGYGQVSIIHGKGTGALRAGLQDFFRKHPHIKTARLGEFGEGGSGVTVVELK